MYTAEDADGQDKARLRLSQTTDVTTFLTGWSGQTIFDLQIDAPPGFNFSASQFISGAGIFAGPAAPVVPQIAYYINAQSLHVVNLPNPAREC